MIRFFQAERRVGLFASVGVAALAMSAPALAQDAETEEEVAVTTAETPEQTAAETRGITVTGSRIRRDVNLDSVVPVISVTRDEILNDGNISLGDALNDLPALRSTFNSSNSQRFIGTTGLNLLDLRGLGTARTLTVVNGRRHVTSSVGSFQVDTNTIPSALLERVDVVTGGSSAVYGSEAIAGVVNFVLRDDYEGLQLDSLVSISDRGDGRQFSVEGVWGKNFADGRGNITLAAEYADSQRVFNSQRPEISGFGIGFTSFVTNPDDTTAEGLTNSNGIPDNILARNLLLDFISDGGTVQTFCLSDEVSQPLACDANGLERRFRFGADGRLFGEVTDQFAADGLASNGTGTALSDGTLLPDIERTTINLLANFEVSSAFRPFVEFKYVNIDTLGQGTPSFFNSFCGGLAGASGLDPSCADVASSAFFFVPITNAFLDPADAQTITNIQDELLGFFGLPAGLSQGFFINRNNSDFGTRNDKLNRETYRFVGGVDGDISSNTRYELSFSYGRFTTQLEAQNDLIFANTRAALDSVVDGGNIVCRVNVDADPSNDLPGCVPLNPFGFGAPSDEALAFINTTSQLDGKAQQYNVLGFISTDSSPFFELPGGPVGVVVGGEWRRETAFEQPDEFSAGGNTFFNAFDVFDPPALEVYELFGEINVPLLANRPFFEELTFTAAGRISDYNSGAGSTGTVEAWNLNGIWAPIRDLRFRANFSRSVRSPTLSDLFSPQTVNFLFFNDPCDVDFIDQGSGTRAANCLAAGVPVGFDENITGNRSVLQGGNTLLRAETSDSFTAGAIIQPRFLPGFSLSVDYYNIDIDNVIANVGPQAILNNCFDAADLNNTFCEAIRPRQPDGSLDVNAALVTGPINFAALTAEGLDFDARYVRTFGNGHRLSLRAIATYVIDRTNFLDTNNPEVPNDVRGELGDPVWAANFNAAYTAGAFTLSWSGRFVDSQFNGARENINNNIELCTTGTIPRTDTPCTTGELVKAPPRNPDVFDAEFQKFPTRLTQDVRLDIDIEDNYRFTVGVDNITDKLPPFGLTGAGAGSGIFSNRGRTFFASFRAEL
jgi:outer membrane receptor protein involved in Fe transport